MIRIVSDTSTMYSRQQAQQAGFDVSALSVTIAGSTYREFDEIDADAPWWDASVSKAQSYLTGDDLYFLAGNVSLITAEDTMCIFFNEDMVTDLGLEMLYDIVRAGEWTIDKLIEYALQRAQ